MTDKHICADCNREFQSPESLSQHRVAKHVVHPSEPVKRKKFPVKLAAVAIVLLLAAGAYLVFAGGGEKPLVDPNNPPGDKLQKLLDFNLKAHSGNLAFHIHPILQIDILGQQEIIPTNIGITNRGMRVIHTHDATGSLHIESPEPYEFHLADFFMIWEKNYNESCIFDYCVDEGHELSVYVNGVKSADWNIPLRDKERIIVRYERKQEA